MALVLCETLVVPVPAPATYSVRTNSRHHHLVTDSVGPFVSNV